MLNDFNNKNNNNAHRTLNIWRFVDFVAVFYKMTAFNKRKRKKKQIPFTKH